MLVTIGFVEAVDGRMYASDGENIFAWITSSWIRICVTGFWCDVVSINSKSCSFVNHQFNEKKMVHDDDYDDDDGRTILLTK